MAKTSQKKTEHKGKKTTRRRFYLAVWAGLDDLPGLGVHIIAVELVGQRVVCSPPEHVEVPVEGHHRVPVTALGRGRRTPQQVLRGDPCPAGTENRVVFDNSSKLSDSILLHQEAQRFIHNTLKYYASQLKQSRIMWILHDLTAYTYIFSLNSNWKRLLVIFAPLWPEKTNILSLQTATGKLQQEGGISPLCSIWKVILGSKSEMYCYSAQLHILRMLQGHGTQVQPERTHGRAPVKLATGNRLLLCLCVCTDTDSPWIKRL